MALAQGVVAPGDASIASHPLKTITTDPTDADPTTIALSSELQSFPANRCGGEDALFKILTGRPKSPNQSLDIFLQKEAIVLGPLCHGDEAQLKIRAAVQNISNCHRDDVVSGTVSASSTVTDVASWSTTKTRQSATEHAVKVSDKVKILLAGERSTKYSFKNTQTDSPAQTDGGSQTKSYTLAFNTTLSATKDKASFYRAEVVHLVLWKPVRGRYSHECEWQQSLLLHDVPNAERHAGHRTAGLLQAEHCGHVTE